MEVFVDSEASNSAALRTHDVNRLVGVNLLGAQNRNIKEAANIQLHRTNSNDKICKSKLASTKKLYEKN